MKQRVQKQYSLFFLQTKNFKTLFLFLFLKLHQRNFSKKICIMFSCEIKKLTLLHHYISYVTNDNVRVDLDNNIKLWKLAEYNPEKGIYTDIGNISSNK